jgi:Anti-sigma factor NepR
MKVVPTCENNVRLAIQEEIGKGLRSYYDEVVKEGIPGCLIDLVGRLEETDKACSTKQE